MLRGKQSWDFPSNPVIISSATVGGPFEANGAIPKDFDLLHEDIWLEQESFEKAEKTLLEEACKMAIKKASLTNKDIQMFISGDLMDQIISSSFTARTLSIPFLGIFGACSSAMQGLALAALIVDSKGANNVLTGAASHNSSVEKQFRYPTEYGGQKPPTAQWTVTGAGAAVLSQQGNGPKVTSATIGKVIDMGLKDPFNMGSAMAPAAVNTIEAHFNDFDRDPSYYDLIVTGDLGSIGHKIARDMLKQHGVEMPWDRFGDCGLMIYKKSQPIFAGASGCGCSAVVTYGHLLNKMRRGELKKILVVATGALLSPLSYQQKESIPGVAHAVSIEI